MIQIWAYKEKNNDNYHNFSLEKLKKDTEKDTCSGFKETKISSIILCLDLLKPFSDKQNLIEFIARRRAL